LGDLPGRRRIPQKVMASAADLTAGRAFDPALTRALLGNALEHPVLFAEMALDVPLWSGQIRVADAVTTDRRVSVRSGHALGKSLLTAMLAVWWTLHRSDAVCILVGPSATQLAAAAWGYVRTTINTLRRLGIPAPFPTTGVGALKWELTEKNYLLGLSTDRPERLSGYHAGAVLVIVDEASKLTSIFWQTLAGLLAGGDSKVLLVGNPLWPGGIFYDTHHKDRGLWTALHLDILESPNFAGVASFKQLLEMSDAELDSNPVPNLATKRAARDSLLDWTEESPLFDVRVRGDFPRQSEWAVYPLPLLEERREPSPPLAYENERVSIGIDPAGAGRARTAFLVLDGANVAELRATRDPDSLGILLDWLRPWKDRDPAVAVDATGIGFGFCKVIRDAGYRVFERHFGGQADRPDRFRMWRSEIAWTIRDALKENALGQIPDSKETPLLAEMASILYRPNTRDQIELESKDTRATRGLESTDLFDALCLAMGERGRTVRGSYAFPNLERVGAIDQWISGGDLEA
jgi:hypothetical protein